MFIFIQLMFFCSYTEFHPLIFNQHEDRPFLQLDSFNKVRLTWIKRILKNDIFVKQGVEHFHSCLVTALTECTPHHQIW